MTYFCPALDPPLGGSGRKTTTLVRDLEYFIHTKFHQNPSSGSEEEVENVNCLTDDRRQTDAGQRVITIGHWSLWLLCPKNCISIPTPLPIFFLVQPPPPPPGPLNLSHSPPPPFFPCRAVRNSPPPPKKKKIKYVTVMYDGGLT